MPLMTLGVFAVIFIAVSVAVIAGKRLLTGSLEDAPPGEPNLESEQRFDWGTPVIAPMLLREETHSAISVFDRILASVDGVEIVKARIREAGLHWSVGRLLSMMMLAGAATFAMSWPMSWIPAFASIIMAFCASLMPYLVVFRRRAQRMAKFEDQFPDAMDSLARSLRAGNALSGALDILSRETPQPLGAEFRKALDERNLGLSWDQALANLSRRIPIIEVRIFAASVQLQTRTGGKLHEVLGKLAENMRESSALKGEVRSIAAHGKMTGAILTILPVVIAFMMAYVNPSSMLVLWTDPLGHQLVWLAIGCLIAAHFVIRKMVDVKI